MKTNPPSRDAIARHAYEIWISSGTPHGYDIGHWLEAERQLTAAAANSTTGGAPATGPATARSAVEPAHATGAAGPSPDALAAQAASQKHAARAPQLQHGKDAPHAAPPESGKPLWDQPHSS
jgi:hypothetical protein